MVVPIPDALGSRFERSYTRRFASWISDTIRCSPSRLGAALLQRRRGET